MAKADFIIPSSGTVEITAAADGEKKLPTFSFHGYTGEPMNLKGFFNPVIVDLAGAQVADPITALMNHDDEQIVGQGSATVDETGVRATGTVMSEDANAQKLATLSKNGFKWQASIGAAITRREFLEAGKKASVNGREVTGPMVIARESLIDEISFVRRGADSKTSAAVAASRSPGKVTDMEPKFVSWLQANGYADVDGLNAQQLKPLKAQWEAEIASHDTTPRDLNQVFATKKAETQRQSEITAVAQEFLDDNPFLSAEDISNVELRAQRAIADKTSAKDFHYDLLVSVQAKQSHGPYRPYIPGSPKLNSRVLEAAVCMAGRLEGHEKMFDDQTLQAAHDQFRNGIGLKQIFLLCAQQNGHHANYAGDVTIEAQRAAFGMTAPNRIQAAGFSGLNISNVLSNTANKFLMEGWNAIDMTPMRISAVRPVRDFKQITTVSLTGDLMYDKVSATGEIKHGTLADLTYNNQADTYARMLAITRKDIINDDLGALTAVPRRLGRGAALLLNDIFWTEWLVLVSANFFVSGNNNINTGAADMTLGGLTATETIFMNQTDPDGKPLGIQPAIIVVPTALKAAATALMSPGQNLFVTGASATIPNVNVYAGRFRVESSPYISNSSYTGNTAVGWWMIANPSDLPLIEIAALNGRVEPVVETADAEFNVLGVQMRGYSDVGVTRQEKRAGVYADGGAS
jgi:phage head maturation protease